MEYICRLVMRQDLRHALAVPQITLFEIQIRQTRKCSRAVSQISANHVPPLVVEELDQMRSDKSLCAGYQCVLFHWSSYVVSRWNMSVRVNTRIHKRSDSSFPVRLLRSACRSGVVKPSFVKLKVECE